MKGFKRRAQLCECVAYSQWLSRNQWRSGCMNTLFCLLQNVDWAANPAVCILAQTEHPTGAKVCSPASPATKGHLINCILEFSDCSLLELHEMHAHCWKRQVTC